MANVKISALPAVTTVVPGSDVLPLVSGGITTKATPNAIVQAVLPAPGAIGGTTPGSGAFTTLSASSTVSGTGFSNYLASPPAIGGTAAAAGSFTNLSYTGTFTGSTGVLNIGSGQIYKDTSGNVGIGTSSPQGKLAVSNSGAEGLEFLTNTSGLIGIQSYNRSTSAYIQQSYVGSFFTWTTGGVGERARIDSSGNLLVGTTSTNSFTSATIFSIKGLAVAWNDAQYIGMPYNAGTGYYNGLYLNAGTRETNIRAIADDGASKITFSTGITAVERARIDGSGNLLVGTTSLIAGTEKVAFKFSSNTGPGLILSDSTIQNGATFAGFYASTTRIGSITANGTTGVLYNITSDQRLKDNIVDAPSALSSVNAIKVRSFDWKADGSHVDYGYIAQELLEVAPEAVSVPADLDEMMGVDFGKLTPRLVKAIQELSAELNELKQKVNA